MFRDRHRIEIASGKGGDGIASFRREKNVPRGGPDGGDGGVGGSVYIFADPAKSHLGHLSKMHYRAENGGNGESCGRTGKGGEDVIIPVAPGTQIYDDNQNLLYDLEANTKVCIAAGGAGGVGNIHYKTSTNQAPRFCKLGQPGISMILHLRLRLSATFGLIGAPNAGKSSILRAISNAQPLVGDYAFTTLTPQIGMTHNLLSVIDIPGLIEGAHLNRGLGHDFLDHIAKCGALVCVLDASDDPDKAFGMLMAELQMYDPGLIDRIKLVILNKCDLAEIRGFNCDVDVLHISATENINIDIFLEKLHMIYQQLINQSNSYVSLQHSVY